MASHKRLLKIQPQSDGHLEVSVHNSVSSSVNLGTDSKGKQTSAVPDFPIQTTIYEGFSNCTVSFRTFFVWRRWFGELVASPTSHPSHPSHGNPGALREIWKKGETALACWLHAADELTMEVLAQAPILGAHFGPSPARCKNLFSCWEFCGCMIWCTMDVHWVYLGESSKLVVQIRSFSCLSLISLSSGEIARKPSSIVPGEVWCVRCGYPTRHVKGTGSHQTTTSFTSYRWPTHCDGSHLWTFIERSGPIFGCWFHGYLDGIWTLKTAVLLLATPEHFVCGFWRSIPSVIPSSN